jgi:predicted nucleic-acid-binding Zn-ribbon protein
MRTTHRCPKCEGTKLYVCENRQPNHRYSNSVVNFHITSVRLIDEGGSESRHDVGAYETWSCAACGYTEWYAQDKDGVLERLSKVADSGVRVIDSGASSPFR